MFVLPSHGNKDKIMNAQNIPFNNPVTKKNTILFWNKNCHLK